MGKQGEAVENGKYRGRQGKLRVGNGPTPCAQSTELSWGNRIFGTGMELPILPRPPLYKLRQNPKLIRSLRLL